MAYNNVLLLDKQSKKNKKLNVYNLVLNLFHSDHCVTVKKPQRNIIFKWFSV